MTGNESQSRKLIRGLWWAAFVALVLVEVLLSTVPMAYSLQRLTSDAVIYFTPMLLTIVAGIVLTSRVRGDERRFWGLLTLATAMIVGSEMYWTWYAAFVDFRGPPWPSWWQIGDLAALVIFWTLIVSMTNLGSAPVSARLRFYLDIASGCVVAYAAVYWWGTLPLYGTSPAGILLAATTALYPVFGILMLLTTGLIVFGWKAYRWRTWERLLTAAFAMYALGMSVYPWLYANLANAPVPTGIDWYTTILGFGYYLLFMTMVYRITDGPDSSPVESWNVPKVRPAWLPALYPPALGVALAVLGLAALRVGGPPEADPIVWSAILLAPLLILRSWSASMELAYHRNASITDPITGVFNRRHLEDRLRDSLSVADERATTVALVVVDLVDFKSTDDVYGHEAGNRLLSLVAMTLKHEAAPSGSVFRVGRDEFAVLFEGANAEDGAAYAHRVSARVAAETGAGDPPTGVSAGVAIYPEHAKDGEELLAHALAAQQLARVAEGTDILVYTASIVDAADPLERLELSRAQSHRARLRSLASSVDARYPDTRFHSESVAELASAFALVLELPEAQASVLDSSARLHDLGMIGVRDEVLTSLGPLTEDERTSVERHPELAVRLLEAAGLSELAPAVRHHHERWDGTGYPDGLGGESIPFEARVLALCDSFDAMTSPRSFRLAMSTSAAIAEIISCSETQFDPHLAVVFTRMVTRMRGQSLRERMAASRAAASQTRL